MCRIFLFLLLLLQAGSGLAQPLPQRIDAILAGAAVANNSWSILIEDDAGDFTYYSRNPTTVRTPASNTKMYTTAAAFGLLGMNHAFDTRIYHTGTLSGGAITGNIVLMSEHDPTWNTTVFGSGNARVPLNHMAARLFAQGVRSVSGNVLAYGWCIYNKGSTNTGHTNVTTLNAESASAFRDALIAAGIQVTGTTSTGHAGFVPPAGSTLLYTHKSTDLTWGGRPLTVEVASIPLNRASHNVMADLMLRHIGYKGAANDSYSSGASRVLAWLSAVGINTTGMVMNDGSGLSSGNKFSARQTVDLTRFMRTAYPAWELTLPLSCNNGTISGRLCGSDVSGAVRAKTGSLSSTISLSGFVTSKHDGRRYYFSFLANRSGIDQTATRNAIDAAVTLIGERSLPIGPELLAARSTAGAQVKLEWANPWFSLSSYRVYTSTDGINFPTFVPVTPQPASAVISYTTTAGAAGGRQYFRVVAVNPAGKESTASNTFSVFPGYGTPPILIVDGNERWRYMRTENASAGPHRFAAVTADAITGRRFDTASANGVESGLVPLSNYKVAIYALGEESTNDETFSTAEQTIVTQYLNAGGAMMVTGAEIGWDLDNLGTTADRNFFRNFLRQQYAADDANTHQAAPVANRLYNGLGTLAFSGGQMPVNFPDVVTAVNGSLPALTYSTGGVAGIQYEGAYRLVSFGFPFESINTTAMREAVMTRSLNFLLPQSSSFIEGFMVR